MLFCYHDLTLSCFPSSGYKEFDPYLTALESKGKRHRYNPIIVRHEPTLDIKIHIFLQCSIQPAPPYSPTDSQPADTLIPLKLSCTDMMKVATRRYAKKQVHWIRNKLLPAVQASEEEVTERQGTNVRMYLLDATCILFYFILFYRTVERNWEVVRTEA